MSKIIYAHSSPGRSVEKWQPLEEHLKNVAKLASDFARPFGGDQWAGLAGLWHDIGKYSDDFQAMLKKSIETEPIVDQVGGRIDHSTAGARCAVQKWPDAGKLLAYVIAGHHGGLPDGRNSSRSDLTDRLDPRRSIPPINKCSCPVVIDTAEKPTLPFKQEAGRIGFQLAFFIRMVFSCLVDADFLDTEKFLDPEKALQRVRRATLAELDALLFNKLGQFKPDSVINQKRADILQNCVDAARKPPGLYTLTVPTGGGKTLSSLAFALRHAQAHKKRRCIYVIPFTSIIEQNAAVFRSILGDESILEHHSNFAYDQKNKSDEKETSLEEKRHRLACENWDAPVIVTTNVQFFDSLFANRTSKCRKLHNIANSVIILDEAQMLPEPYLRPCMEAIKELINNYGCTIILCTATQPALQQSPSFPYGFPDHKVTEIIGDPQKLHTEFKRVQLHNIGAVSDEGLASHISRHENVLCIVNTRQRAADLFTRIKGLSSVYHLSARMCPAHRSELLSQIRDSLDCGRSCRVISTQIVEAGVDIDFPIVYREIAGMDSIAQAAGRCNRNAKLTQGDVYVFLPENARLPKMFRRAAAAAESVLNRHEDPFSPTALRDYFSQVYWIAGEELDKKQLLKQHESGIAMGDLPFRQIAEQFRLIESNMVPVIVPWNEKAHQLVHKLSFAKFPLPILRQLQSFVVQIYTDEFTELEKLGAIEMIQNRYPAIVSAIPFYDPDCGISIEEASFSPDNLIL